MIHLNIKQTRIANSQMIEIHLKEIGDWSLVREKLTELMNEEDNTRIPDYGMYILILNERILGLMKRCINTLKSCNNQDQGRDIFS